MRMCIDVRVIACVYVGVCIYVSLITRTRVRMYLNVVVNV